MSDTNPQNRPPLSGAEIEALATRSPEKRAQLVDELALSRGERRRLEREVEAADAQKRRYKGKLTTRADVIQILALYLERNVRPYDVRLNHIEEYIRYCQLPLWRRWWIQLLSLAGRLTQFLGDRLPVTLLYLKSKESDHDVPTDDDGHDDRKRSFDTAPPADLATGRHETDRLDGSRDGREDGC